MFSACMTALPLTSPRVRIFQGAGKASIADHSRIVTLTALHPSRISIAKPEGARSTAALRVA
jgi:hypothetical protein